MKKSTKKHGSLLNKIKHLLGYQDADQVPLDILIENIMSYYENIIECMPGNVYWLDKQGVTVGCNQNVLNMFGLKSFSAFKGLSFKDMAKIGHWSEATATSFEKDTLDVIRTGKPKLNVEEPPIPNSKGQLTYFLTHRVPLFDKQKNVVGIVGISIDITPRKKMEIALNKAKEAAEAANLAKTEFIANMSHDLRTPLTGVIGISEILSNLEANSELKQYAEDIHQCGDQLLNMMNSILDDASTDHINKNDLVEEVFDLLQCIKDIEEVEKPSIILNKIKLLIDFDDRIPKHIISDRTKIHRILLNLVGNAVKFTHQGSITIKTELLDISKNKVLIRVEVTDTGIGIPSNQQDKVFDRFFRATPSYKGQYSGYGVGLHIAQSYAQLLGGEIRLTSQERQGTTFYFDFPSKIGNEDAKTCWRPVNDLHHSVIKKCNPLRLLLVEDNSIALKVLESIVSSYGLKFESATDGESALALAKSYPFDLIITDIGLPGISGNDFSRAFRIWEKSQNKTPISIIGLTAHAHDEIKKECLDSGMTDVFSKPMTFDLLKTILSAHTAIVKLKTISSALSQTRLGLDLPNTEKELFALTTFPLFDVEKALLFIGNNKETLKSLLMMVVNQEIPTEKAAIQEAYTKKDWNTVEKLAHKMKGGAVYYGVVKMQFACQYLERYHKAGYHELLEKLYTQLIQVIDDTQLAITIWLENN